MRTKFIRFLLLLFKRAEKRPRFLRLKNGIFFWCGNSAKAEVKRSKMADFGNELQWANIMRSRSRMMASLVDIDLPFRCCFTTIYIILLFLLSQNLGCTISIGLIRLGVKAVCLPDKFLYQYLNLWLAICFKIMTWYR